MCEKVIVKVVSHKFGNLEYEECNSFQFFDFSSWRGCVYGKLLSWLWNVIGIPANVNCNYTLWFHWPIDFLNS